MRRANLRSMELDESLDLGAYRWKAARLGSALGAERIGARLYELPDGARTFPYHFHRAIEEWLVVVSGMPTLRDPDGERVLRGGDVVCFPTGPEGAHQVIGPGTVLILSANRDLEVCEYPDSGKVGLSSPRMLFRVSDSVDYWEGE